MDIAPIYELQNRLRSSMIAGSNLLGEDFRLQRAAKDMEGLAKVSGVFGKISQLMQQLFAAEEQERPRLLLEAITLTDAVLCTMASVEPPVNTQETLQEFVPLEGNKEEQISTDAPYSLVSTLIEALTTSGDGHYSQVVEMKEKYPELFKDFRVKQSLVEGLGASYFQLAEDIMDWMIQEKDPSMVALLKREFDPQGKKVAVRIIYVIEAIAGAKENDFYIKHISGAQKDARKALIFALRHDSNNVELLLDLTKSERGAAKKTAIHALAFQEGTSVESYFRELAKKKKTEVLQYLQGSTRQWATDLCVEVLQQAESEEEGKDISAFYNVLEGKSGQKVADFYRKSNPSKELADIMLNSYVRTQDVCLAEAAAEIVKKNGNREQIQSYYPVVVISKLLQEENWAEWLEEQLSQKNLFEFESLTVKKRMIAKALSYLKLKEGSYCMKVDSYEPFMDRWESYWKECSLDIKGTLAPMLVKYPCKEFDKILYDLMDEKDEEMCREYGKWFSQRAYMNPQPNYLNYLKKCNADYIPGLAREYVKKNPQVQTWNLVGFMESMPGNPQQKREEVKLVQEFLKEGKEKRDISVEYLDHWAENCR